MFVKNMQIKLFIVGEEIRGKLKDPRKDLFRKLLIQSIKITCFLFYKETDQHHESNNSSTSKSN